MTDLMAQPGLRLTAPTSRQDIISALLNDYGNSFGRGDGSPSAYSPVPAMKELPPTPPLRPDSIQSKPLPAVQRMNTKFQLRVDEDTPSSPHSPGLNSPAPKSTKRIVSRSLSRESKPPSLKLTISNGTTATIPPTPVLPAQVLPSSQPAQEKELPPPPPEKSERRNTRQAPMGNDLAQVVRGLGRNDSLLSQGKVQASSDSSSKPEEASPTVKRKALPETAVKRFKSLAELGQGPRGGKGGPLPRTSASSKISVDSQASDTAPSKVTMGSQTSEDSNIGLSDATVTPENVQEEAQAPANNQLPPTPDEDQSMAPPAPPRKAFAPIGLPSNPRSKAPASPLHMRGKSSTGFSVLQPHRVAPRIPTASLTPEMTPSPKLKPVQPSKGAMSPLSPLPPPKDQHRPFSYETPAETQNTMIAQPDRPATASAASPTALLPSSPVRPTSLDLESPEPKSQSPTIPAQATAAAPAPTVQDPLDQLSQFPAVPSKPLPQPPQSNPLPELPQSQQQQPQSPPKPTTPPPFTPLTRHPLPLPTSLIPQITSTHLTCYTLHATNVWSNNSFQPLGCMVCRANEPERKWTCTWCRLRICAACSDELGRIKGRELAVLVERRGVSGAGGEGGGLGMGRRKLSREEEGELGDVVGVGFGGRFGG
ncbi:hypothetical protein T440DRAFT_383443 [Plenodomus tracheiphilus IPT5]|uniref:Uncharacterized protein n=1 Tax=Plenodomus tracheiphilus IPT5 TaxID=1408161 RepID=A0A6A7BR03_9PLEO|nr:hypothetical protein T440DRAFT_383443 [Plenodomus tracheiphilus IPT5]